MHTNHSRTVVLALWAQVLGGSLCAQSQWSVDPVMWPRAYVSMASDPTAGRVHVFGGAQGNDLFRETWSYDGSVWTHASSLPPGRVDDVVYDPIRDRFVAALSGSLIAEWDRTNWTIGPQPNTFSSGRRMLAFDPVRQVTTLVISGVSSTEVHDWNGATWTRRIMTGPTPAWNFNGRIAYEPATGSVLSLTVFPYGSGLHVWRCTGSTWQQVVTPTSPPPLEWFSTARDPITGELLVFGGYESINGSAVTRNALWAFNGISWRLVPTPVAPPVRSAHAMTNDQPNGRALMYGGITFAGSAIWYGDLWSWDGVTWTQLAETAAPLLDGQQLFTAQAVFDRARGEVLAYPLDALSSAQTFDGSNWTTYPCGAACPASPHYLVYDDQFDLPVAVASNGDFAWSNSSWALLPFSPRPVVRPSSAVASTGTQLVMYGGFNGSSPTNQTWTLDPFGWTQHFPSHTPPPQAGHQMASMPSRGEVVMVTTNNRTWTWDGSDWTDRGPVPISSIRDFALQYLPERDRVVLHGGLDYSQITPTLQNAVWEWDGSSWQQATTSNSPFRSGHRLVEGPGQELFLLPDSLNGMARMRSVFQATSEPYGQGCPGSAGLPELITEAWRQPHLGDPFLVQGNGLPPGLALMILGFRDDQWAGQPLPLSLASVGMPGCDALLEPFEVLGALPVGGRASWSLFVPNDPALLAVTFYQQALVFDAAVNAFGATVTNGLRNRVGKR